MLASFWRKFATASSLLVIGVSVYCCSSGDRQSKKYSPQDSDTRVYPNPSVSNEPMAWNKVKAVNYLDQRETWWIHWNDAKRDDHTFCISCHTNLPFVFAQSAVRSLAANVPISDNEQNIVDDVERRVRLWNTLDAYYGEKEEATGNGPASRATEGILNVVILAFHDSETGQLNEQTSLAFKNMWALQQTSGPLKGAWLWQEFRLSPWESRESPYFGATLAALAVGKTPAGYREKPEIQSNLNELRQYLGREYSDQSLLNRVGLLWASTKWAGLLTPQQQQSIVKEIYAKQQSDGGWDLASLTWSPRYLGIPSLLTTHRRNDWTPQETSSDGYATGYITFVLEEAGAHSNAPEIKNATDWLIRNQNQEEGYWTGYSLNRRRDPASDVGRFMTDAATAFALLALDKKGS